MKHVLVAGGTGYLGQRLVRRLMEKGHQVRVLARAGSADPSSNEVNGVPHYNRFREQSRPCHRGRMRPARAGGWVVPDPKVCRVNVW